MVDAAHAEVFDFEEFLDAVFLTILYVMGCSPAPEECCSAKWRTGSPGRGNTTEAVFGGAVTTPLTIELLVLVHAPVPAGLLWGALALFGGLNALGFAIISGDFPKEVVGRGGSGLVMVSVFIVQSGMGYILALWPFSARGHQPAIAYEFASAAPFAMQAAAFVWFLWSSTKPRRLSLVII